MISLLKGREKSGHHTLTLSNGCRHIAAAARPLAAPSSPWSSSVPKRAPWRRTSAAPFGGRPLVRRARWASTSLSRLLLRPTMRLRHLPPRHLLRPVLCILYCHSSRLSFFFVLSDCLFVFFCPLIWFTPPVQKKMNKNQCVIALPFHPAAESWYRFFSSFRFA